MQVPIVHWIERWIANKFGFDVAVHFKNIVTFLAGFIAGSVFTYLLSIINFLHGHSEFKNFHDKDILLAKVTVAGKSKVYARYPKTIFDAIDLTIGLAVIKHKKEDTLRTRQIIAAKIVFYIIMLLVLIFFVYGILSVIDREIPENMRYK